MDTLSAYLRTEFLDHKRELEHLDKLFAETAPLFVDWFLIRGRRGQWPYAVSQYGSIQADRYSASTNAMILFTLSVLSGAVRDSALVPAIRTTASLPGGMPTDAIKRNSGPAIRALAEDIIRHGFSTYSYTFGKNDPFTLVWVLEVLHSGYAIIRSRPTRIRGKSLSDVRRSLLNRARTLISQAKRKPASPLLAWPDNRLSQAPEHAFPLLRAVHIHQLLHRLKSSRNAQYIDLEPLQRYFTDCIHRHLSYNEIPDSGFDAAELTFSLEGLLLTEPERSTDPLVKQVFQVVAERQQRSPYWRPMKPFIASPRGTVLLPLSVEIANSLLRICALLDRQNLGYFSANIGLFNRYAQWLYARVVRFSRRLQNKGRARTVQCVGWCSEHVHAPGTIHLWETSQVLLFLGYYAILLRDHVARTALVHANLSVKRVKRPDEIPEVRTWDAIEGRFEPLPTVSDSSHYRIYQRIATHYVAPRKPTATKRPPANEAHCSLLLYGPPGTGKTVVGENLSMALDCPLIQVTPSDFIVGGEAEVEARAKAIFRTLMEQRDVVIMFDEIDQMILDRDSNLYKDQGDVFKFMSPGMLTKLKDLRKLGQAIFVIATNYEERIDRAAKRPGRIDDLFLVLPPDRQQRYNLLLTLFEKRARQDRGTLERGLGKALVHAADATSLFVFGELDRLVQEVLAHAGPGDGATWLTRLRSALNRRVEDARPAISLASYKSRFRILWDKPEDFQTEQEPMEEFLLLLRLVLEVGHDLGKDKDWIQSVLLSLKDYSPLTLVDRRHRIGESLTTVKDDRIVAELLSAMKGLGWCA
ncbi:MAG: ATP-binding protein [Nitrososphaera sp.]|nr:ATP-binding protein [Nitrososphaera sp.]